MVNTALYGRMKSSTLYGIIALWRLNTLAEVVKPHVHLKIPYRETRYTKKNCSFSTESYGRSSCGCARIFEIGYD